MEFGRKMQHEPESEDWRHNVPAAETMAPSPSETVLAQSHPVSPPIHPGTSPDNATRNSATAEGLRDVLC